ncbi:DUF998 domain-containing protein [Mycolicibacterium neoaurum]|uniref:DUF998 domain-containing protein n=1 Tax=Mycolicibacterium neoaurum TaxID=1795 RepID=UPI002671E302|nr:DUF998 domain-containing protein [Mycolicibacterium neoaurum]MDO3398734.1 DUF998 domain-containing protein [Mycolicibacterium neoaurum]
MRLLAGEGVGPAAALWVLGAVGYFAAEALAAAALPGYRYGDDYISALGNPAVSPHATWMNVAFALQGLCFAAAALLATRASRRRRWFSAFAVANGLGNILIAVVHSGQGNGWHVIGAGLAIIGGNAAALSGAGWPAPRWYRGASALLGLTGLVCLAVTVVGPAAIGAWERAAVYPIFAWQLMTAGYLLSGRSHAGSGSSML